jgi:hypothetical protein
MSANQEFRKSLGNLFSEIAIAVNEIADACKDENLKERFFALKRCFEQGKVICSTTSKKRGEEAPEFTPQKGESCRIVDL